jgi:hypothetical protein
VFDAIAALGSTEKQETLRLAFFDILQLENAAWNTVYSETYKKLSGIFTHDLYCAPVRCKEVTSKAKVKEIFDQWVNGEGSEGLVVRSLTSTAVKIKPRLSVDVAIIGFSESDIPGFVRTLLYALVNEDGTYQIIGRTGNGLNGDQKKELWNQLMPLKVPSNYVEIDSNHVAFHLIKPMRVMELSVGDVLCETSSGGITNPVLKFNSDHFNHTGTAPGFSFVSAVIERFRDDKKPDEVGTRISQISERFYRPAVSHNRGMDNLAPSKLLVRDVYIKESASPMVMKFMVWKTNKETANYPSFVFSFTNFSTGRADPLTVDMRVSNSEDQIMSIYRDFVAKNVKPGWLLALGGP